MVKSCKLKLYFYNANHILFYRVHERDQNFFHGAKRGGRMLLIYLFIYLFFLFLGLLVWLWLQRGHQNFFEGAKGAQNLFCVLKSLMTAVTVNFGLVQLKQVWTWIVSFEPLHGGGGGVPCSQLPLKIAPRHPAPLIVFCPLPSKIVNAPWILLFFCFHAPCSLAYLAPFSRVPKTPCGGSH